MRPILVHVSPEVTLRRAVDESLQCGCHVCQGRRDAESALRLTRSDVEVLAAALIEMMERHKETECYVLKPDVNRHAKKTLEIKTMQFGTSIRLA